MKSKLVRGTTEYLLFLGGLTAAMGMVGAQMSSIVGVDFGASVFMLGYLTVKRKGDKDCIRLFVPDAENSHSDN